ncbi:MAG: DUF262 domain-containing HNH endonuclease family protein [Cyanobacteria bacterium P01_G01_bin.67]
MKKIDAKPRTLEELLSQKYTIDYYQREYKWQTQQILELLEDLKERFIESYNDKHEHREVEKYSRYFLGDIIISARDNKKFIIDGQQRLTSLTLLLIYIHHQIKEQYEEDDGDVKRLIASTKFSQKSFNIEVEERKEAFKAIYEGKIFNINDQPESVINIVERYNDIESEFPEDLKDDVLLYFKDWLINNVDIVEITAYSDEDAYIIFETMNDRGLSLTPTEMLKGYLLSNIKIPEHRIEAEKIWRKTIIKLFELGKNEDSTFIKTWLRAKYAESVRGGGNKYTVNQDYENISPNFYKWVRNEQNKIGLNKSYDFQDFIQNKLQKFANYYIRIRKAADNPNTNDEFVYFNATNQFNLQYPLILASLEADDSHEAINKKINLVSGYIDIFIVRKIVNNKSLAQAANTYKIFSLMKQIRGLSVDNLSLFMKNQVKSMEYTFDNFVDFSLNRNNKKYVRHVLARITHHLHQECGSESDFNALIRTKKNGQKNIDLYQIEHIIADKYERHTDEFEEQSDFSNWRNYIGGLLLLPESFNKSFGDKPYEDKIEQYFGQNLLAKSLSEKCYQNNPEFLKYKQRSNLPFQAHKQFGKIDIRQRQLLYKAICEEIWSINRFNQ